jgi:hypothetical protein
VLAKRASVIDICNHIVWNKPDVGFLIDVLTHVYWRALAVNLSHRHSEVKKAPTANADGYQESCFYIQPIDDSLSPEHAYMVGFSVCRGMEVLTHFRTLPN